MLWAVHMVTPPPLPPYMHHHHHCRRCRHYVHRRRGRRPPAPAALRSAHEELAVRQVERHGGVKAGDVIIKVNDTKVATKDFQAVLELLSSLNGRSRALTFVGGQAHYKARRAMLTSGDEPGGTPLTAHASAKLRPRACKQDAGCTADTPLWTQRAL